MEIITSAANILEISEYEVLIRAYRKWHGVNAAQQLIQKIFSDYLNNNLVPYWARHYALEVIRAFELEAQANGGGLALIALWYINVWRCYKNPRSKAQGNETVFPA